MDAERFGALKQQVRDSGAPARTVLSSASATGSRFFDVTIAPRHDAEGRAIGIVTAAWDISAQKRRENEEHLLAEAGRVLVAAGPDVEALLTEIAHLVVGSIADWCTVDLVHPGGLRRLRVIHKDPARAATCAGLERYPVHQRNNLVADVVRSRETLLVSELTPAALESLAQSPEHLALLRELDPRSFIVAPLVARGQAVGTLSFGSSGAGRRYGAEDVHQAERLATLVALAVDNARLHADVERAVLARDEVLGVVAHDLRNPLGAIRLATQTLAHQLSEQGAERGHRSVELIRRSVQRANRLIDDLLDVTRMDAGELHVTCQHCPARLLVYDAVESQQLLAAAATIELSFDVAPDLPAVWADRDRCLQVLENLIGNAIKFTPPGGRIVVTAVPAGGEVRFSVADSGPGIAAEHRTRVFDRFWQAEHAKRRGVGLGLQICKGIVAAHGGRIWVESTPGGGATFQFTLPISVATSNAPPRMPAPQAPVPAAGSQRSILVVEDEDAARVALAELLRDLGYQVLVASTPAEALQLSGAREGAVDLLLTDLRLPQMQGDQLAARLRAARPRLKVIFMSGDAGASPAGDAFVPKPIDFDALGDAIARVLA